MATDITPVDPTSASTTKEYIIRTAVSAFVTWATPVITAFVMAGIGWASTHIGKVAVMGLNPQQIITWIVSGLVVVLVTGCTLLYKVLTEHVVVLQEVLKKKGLLNVADGWFGIKSLTATVAAVNSSSVTITPAVLADAVVKAETDGAPPDPDPKK